MWRDRLGREFHNIHGATRPRYITSTNSVEMQGEPQAANQDTVRDRCFEMQALGRAPHLHLARFEIQPGWKSPLKNSSVLARLRESLL